MLWLFDSQVYYASLDDIVAHGREGQSKVHTCTAVLAILSNMWSIWGLFSGLPCRQLCGRGCGMFVSPAIIALCCLLLAPAEAQAREAGGSGKPNGFQKPVRVSAELSAFLGSTEPVSRPQLTKRFWEYFKEQGLQNPADKRCVNCACSVLLRVRMRLDNPSGSRCLEWGMDDGRSNGSLHPVMATSVCDPVGA
jgi:hypothetical protein